MSSKLPPPFIRSLKENFGLEDELLVDSINKGESVASVLLNPFKPSSLFENEEIVPWSANGRYLRKKSDFTADPLFHAGCYSIQEASSLFMEQALKNNLEDTEAVRVLDLFAAHGGKSTLISSLLSADSLLISNEVNKNRVPVLIDNLNKWGPTNIFVSNNEPLDFNKLPGYFDTIVVDAPCSGSGRFRTDRSAISQWSESAVQLFTERQKHILADLYPALKENGTLIYSTYSYSRQENEDIGDWLFEEFNMSSVRIPLDDAWGIQETNSEKSSAYGYRFYPHKLKGEGLYMACFRKNDKSEATKTKRVYQPKANPNDEELIKMWLKPDSDLILQSLNDEQFAIRSRHFADLDILKTKLNLKKVGTRFGKVIGKDVIPHHELALSLVNHPQTTRLNLSKDQAVEYLRRNEVKVVSESRGWALVCYNNYPLGWAKILHNRINNYYPKELRMVKQPV